MSKSTTTRKYSTNDFDFGCRLTDCCGAYSNFDQDSGELCCKACWNVVDFGEGDGSEYKPGLENLTTKRLRAHGLL